MSTCLTYTRLEEIAQSEDGSADEIQRHLQACPACREKLEEVRANLAFADRVRPFARQAGDGSDAPQKAGFPDDPGTDAYPGHLPDVFGYVLVDFPTTDDVPCFDPDFNRLDRDDEDPDCGKPQH
jgi:hypothetical protein